MGRQACKSVVGTINNRTRTARIRWVRVDVEGDEIVSFFQDNLVPFFKKREMQFIESYKEYNGLRKSDSKKGDS